MSDIIWKLIGYVGAGLFALRWVIHLWHRRRTRSAEVPTVFWIMSLVGGLMTTAYFIWGKPDGVGLVQSLGPLLVTVVNLYLDLDHQRDDRGQTDAADRSAGDDSDPGR